MSDQGTTLEEQDYQRRVAEFDRELKELEAKHRISAMPTISFSPYGIVPQLKYVDKDKIDQLMQQAGQGPAGSAPLAG